MLRSSPLKPFPITNLHIAKEPERFYTLAPFATAPSPDPGPLALILHLLPFLGFRPALQVGQAAIKLPKEQVNSKSSRWSSVCNFEAE